MSGIKDWMQDMDTFVVDAIKHGAKTEDDVAAYVKTHMRIVDMGYVRRTYRDIMKECDFAL